jgi:hypothetical protein
MLLNQFQGKEENLQDSNRVERIEVGYVTGVGNQVVDLSDGDSGSILGGFLGMG